MKKFTVWLLATAFVAVAAFGTSVSAEEQLEKILSPDQIKNFKVMKKEGGALFGIRLEKYRMNDDDKALSNSDSETSASIEEQLEKILSPDQIKNFKVMKKEGGALFGIRLDKYKAENKDRAMSGQVGSNENDDDKTSSKKISEKREKIATPQMISLYEKIRKVGTSLWGVKKENSSNERAEKKQEVKKPSVTITAEMASCVAAAIDTKDASLKTLIADMSTSLQAAVTERSVCQKAALQATDNQRSENDVCIKSFQETSKELSKKNKEGHKQAWDTYKTSLQLCRPVSVTEGEVIVEDGSENIMESMEEMIIE